MSRGRAKNTLESIRRRCIPQENDCWKWDGAHDPRGYARVSWDGKNTKVATLLWETEFREVHPRLELDHICRNKWCVNPYHLEEITHKDNTRRHYDLVDGFCMYGHALEGDNVYTDPDGKRIRCRTCANRWEEMRPPRTH
jgi:hypothetical protein